MIVPNSGVDIAKHTQIDDKFPLNFTDKNMNFKQQMPYKLKFEADKMSKSRIIDHTNKITIN
jgi:hypothetical protein